MALTTGINYCESYFEFPTLTKIHGEPTSEALFLLQNEMKANALSVYSNLSDGAHGHIALVLSTNQYALLTNQPFVTPTHPGVLSIPAGTTAAVAVEDRDRHTEELRLFREVQGVEKALKQQLIQAVEPTYLAAIRNRATNALQGTVFEILEHLQTRNSYN